MFPVRFPFLVLGALLAFAATVGASTVVRLDTPIGKMTFLLFDEAKPVTVANFLNYVTSGRYAHTFAHRLPQGFVLQGGGFTYTAEASTQPVPTFAAIVNEAGPFPEFSNVAGTLAMAKLGDNPNSATSQWFLNLGDNSANLDNQNGGFTTFGSIIGGKDVMAAFAAFKNYAGVDTTNTIIQLDSPFDTIPFTKIVNNQYSTDDLIYTAWTVLPDFKPEITSPPTVIGVKGAPLNFQLTSDVSAAYSVVEGGLPEGLTLSTDGLITGTPTTPGTINLTIQAMVAEDHVATKTIAITISAQPVPLPPLTLTTKAKVVGRGNFVLKGSASVSATKVEVKTNKGGFKKTTGTPAKWSFAVRGLKPGNYKFQVRATSALGQSVVRTVRITVKK